MSIKSDPFLNDLILAFARSGMADQDTSIQKTAGEVRFIKENANEMGLWAYGNSAPANRELTPKFDFQAKNLKPLVECLKYSTAALSYAMVAYDIFTKIPSSSVSPDGRLGGKGYIMKIQDIRKNFMNIVEALSSMSDTIYDELQAPHWAAQTREMEPELKEELNDALEETEKIRTDPENWALSQFDSLDSSPAISKSVDGSDDKIDKAPLVMDVPKPEIVDPRVKKRPVSSLDSDTEDDLNELDALTSPTQKSKSTEESEWVGDMAEDITAPIKIDDEIKAIKKQTPKIPQKPVNPPEAKKAPEKKEPEKAEPVKKEPVKKDVPKPKPEKKQDKVVVKKPPELPEEPKSQDTAGDDDWLEDAKKPVKPPARKGPPKPSASTFDDFLELDTPKKTAPVAQDNSEDDDWLDDAKEIVPKKNVTMDNQDEQDIFSEEPDDQISEDDWINSVPEEDKEVEDEETDWLTSVVPEPPKPSPSPTQKTAGRNDDWKKYTTLKL